MAQPPLPEKHFQSQPEINFSNADSYSTVQLTAFMNQVTSRLSRLESALDEIARLNAALSESEAARKALEAQVASLTRKSSPVSKPALTSASSSTSPSTYAAAAAKNIPQKRKAKNPPPPPRRAAAALARIIGPKSDTPPGYQFVYFKATRSPLNKMRRLFKSVGIDNSRVLDIQYPVGDVVSFLIHNDYVLEFTTRMHNKGRGASPLVEFDPCDPINLKDPKFSSLSPVLRVQKAKDIENLRCLRALSFIRRSVRVSVARSFLERERINQKQFDAVLQEELAARASSAPPPPPKKPSSVEERVAKKQRLLFLNYLLHHDVETARLLAYTPSPVVTPTEQPDDDVEAMKE